MESTVADTPEAMMHIGSHLVRRWAAGDIVLLRGPLGAGKTTLVRGALRALGVVEPVRSPTFNLLQVFQTEPPVLHADLYRVLSAEGLGVEDYLDTHLVLIEWPEHAESWLTGGKVWKIDISFQEGGRSVQITPPDSG